MDNCFITKSCSIFGNEVIIDGSSVYSVDHVAVFGEFTKSIYKHFGIGFPKFYKMDGLSKLAFLTSELLLEGIDIKHRFKPEEIGIVVINSSSTLETDDRHYRTIEDKTNYFPSPAVFVYTLPNIMVGEIAIRNKIMGENITFVAEKYNPQFLVEYVNLLMANERINGCICGWVEYDRTGLTYESFMYLVENRDFTNRNVKFEASFLETQYRDLKV